MKTNHAEACSFEWNCARRPAGANGPLSDEAGLDQLDLTACPRADTIANPFSLLSPKESAIWTGGWQLGEASAAA